MAAAYDLGLKCMAQPNIISLGAKDAVFQLISLAREFRYKHVAVEYRAQVSEVTSRKNKTIKQMLIPDPVSELCGKEVGISCLNRVTIPLSDSSFIHALNSSKAQQFDVVAVDVADADDKLFNQACSELNLDLLVLNVHSERLISGRRLPSLRMAMKRGVCVEIQYSPALQQERTLRNFMSLLQFTHLMKLKKMVVVSSGATAVDYLRSPVAVRDLLMLCGYDKVSALACSSENCERVVRHGIARRSGVMGGVLSIHSPPPTSQREGEMGGVLSIHSPPPTSQREGVMGGVLSIHTPPPTSQREGERHKRQLVDGDEPQQDPKKLKV